MSVCVSGEMEAAREASETVETWNGEGDGAGGRNSAGERDGNSEEVVGGDAQKAKGRRQNAAAKATIVAPVRAGSCGPIENVRLLCSLAVSSVHFAIKSRFAYSL